jgi:hypothetical protein
VLQIRLGARAPETQRLLIFRHRRESPGGTELHAGRIAVAEVALLGSAQDPIDRRRAERTHLHAGATAETAVGVDHDGSGLVAARQRRRRAEFDTERLDALLADDRDGADQAVTLVAHDVDPRPDGVGLAVVAHRAGELAEATPGALLGSDSQDGGQAGLPRIHSVE